MSEDMWPEFGQAIQAITLASIKALLSAMNRGCGNKEKGK
jgi:hypothetical protein